MKRIEHFFSDELIRRLITNSGYLFSATGISAALSMLQGILTARLLGVEGYGILGAIILFTSVINNLASFRMGELVIRYVGMYNESRDDQHAAAVFKSAALFEVLASLVAFLLVFLLAPFGAQYLAKDPATTALFRIYGLIILANLIAESSTGLLQILDRFRHLSALGIIQSVVTLALIGVVYFVQGGLLGVLVAYMVGKTIGALGYSLAAILEATRRWGKDWWRVRLGLLSSKARELVHFAVNTNLSATISLVTKDSEILWVSFFRGPVEAGYYRLALSLANLVELPVSVLPQATYPELSRQAARKHWDNVRLILRQGAILAGSYSLVITLVLIAFGQWLIALLYTPEFLPAYPALIILLIGYLFANTFYWRRPALLALGQPDFPTKVNLTLAVFKVAGVLIFVPRYGYLASAALLAAFYIVGSLIYVWRIRAVLSSVSQQE